MPARRRRGHHRRHPGRGGGRGPAGGRSPVRRSRRRGHPANSWGSRDELPDGGLASVHGPSVGGGGVAAQGSGSPARSHLTPAGARSPTPRRIVVEIVVTGRHTEVPERFRRHLEEKLAKVTQLAPRVQRLDVVVSHEPNRRQSKACDRVEITCLDRGPVVRAEACADDPYAALDVAVGKLFERLRRMRDRKRVHRGRRAPEGLSEVSARAVPVDGSGRDTALATPPVDAEPPVDEGESPVLIREKTHAAVPMSLDQALYEMELVGHDFFLFVDSDTGVPSVVYRRRGWSYGVIRLDRRMASNSASDMSSDLASETASASEDRVASG